MVFEFGRSELKEREKRMLFVWTFSGDVGWYNLKVWELVLGTIWMLVGGKEF